MKSYIGTREESGPRVVVIEGERHRPLGLFIQVRHHAGGFDWGVTGGGASQLALALCCDAVGISPALAIYRAIEADVVAHLPREFRLTDKALHNAIVAIRVRQERMVRA